MEGETSILKRGGAAASRGGCLKKGAGTHLQTMDSTR